MSFSVGIVGLPNSGKSTLFKALTKKQVAIADYPFTTIDPNIGTVAVPDERLEKIAEIVKPEKITPTVIEFVDIAGLVKGAHKGEGMGNQFLSYIRPCDGVIEAIRVFKTANIGEEINPERDIEIIENELLMKDREVGDNVLTAKPKLYLFNIKSEVGRGPTSAKFSPRSDLNGISIDLKLEEEVSELSEQELKELGVKPQLDQLILACYNILGLITFFTTTGKKETRAWTLKKGSDIIEAANKVHSDFAEKFIRAEVAPWEKLIEAGSWKKAREMGKIKLAGKEYIVQNGDVIEFKI